MAEKPLSVRIDGGVARLTLGRPEVHNALDAELIAALSEALNRVAGDDRVRVVLLTAEGENFCAGADLKWIGGSTETDRDRSRTDPAPLGRLLQALDRLPRPTVALVRGAIYGGGIGLAACCDLVLADKNAWFCFSEVRLGLIPAIISPYAVRAIGWRQARRYFLTAETFDAETAHRLGLVHEVTAPRDLERRGERLCAAVMRNSPAAMAAAKNLLAEVGCRPITDGLVDRMVERTATIRTTAEARQGIGAFLNKRPPPWAKS